MTKGFVVPAGGGKRHEDTPGRFFALKLLAGQTGRSIMLFEETVPAGTKSTYHMHHDSDEVVWVLEGEFTFKIGDEVFSGGPGTCAFLPRDLPHAWKNCGPTLDARCFSTRRPPRAAMSRRCSSAKVRSARAERDLELQRHHWERLGPNPLEFPSPSRLC